LATRELQQAIHSIDSLTSTEHFTCRAVDVSRHEVPLTF